MSTEYVQSKDYKTSFIEECSVNEDYLFGRIAIADCGLNLLVRGAHKIKSRERYVSCSRGFLRLWQAIITTFKTLSLGRWGLFLCLV